MQCYCLNFLPTVSNTFVSARAVAKKMVPRLRFSLNWLPFFCERRGKKFSSPIFYCALNAGYQALHLQDDRHSSRKRNTLNNCSKLDFISVSLLVIVVPICKAHVVRNLFQTFHLVDLDCVIWFRYWTIACAQRTCKDHYVLLVITSFSAHKFCQQPVLSNISEQLYFEGAILLPSNSAIWCTIYY